MLRLWTRAGRRGAAQAAEMRERARDEAFLADIQARVAEHEGRQP